MRDFFQKLVEQIKGIFAKLTLIQRLIIIGLLVIVVGAFVFLISYSSSEEKVLLYKANLTKHDFDRVTKKLDGMNIPYSTSDRLIFVENDQIATKTRVQLGLEGVVRDVKGFDLFDNPKFSTTDFERKINLRRAISGNLVKHLEALDDIEKAEVSIAFNERTPLYLKEITDSPITASVIITPSPNSDIMENKKKIRGLRDLIAKAITGLKPENITIADHTGTNLTDKVDPSETDNDLRLAKEQLKIREKMRRTYIKQVRTLLDSTYKDRYEVTVSLDLNWDKTNKVEENIKPIEKRKDNPNTPYDETENQVGADLSTRTTKETFKGPAYIPEGPAGVQPNTGPGIKELVDRNSDYQKTDTITNKVHSKETVEKHEAPMKIERVTIAVALDEEFNYEHDKDGEIKLVTGRVVPKYKKISGNELKDVEEMLKSSIAYDANRKDRVSVKAIRFDRRKEFEEMSTKLRDERKMQNLILVGIISILAVIILFLLIRAIRKELARRKRLKDEELARQQQAMREEAMRIAEEEGLGLDIPAADRARLEMEESAIGLARERPEDVAQLIRTWLVEE